MAKIVMGVLLLIAALSVPSSLAYAFEEPVAGISVSLNKMHSSMEDKPDTEKAMLIYSALYGIDSNLVKAVIGKESSGDPTARNQNRNGTHDRGLMQINSCNFKWLSEELGITDFYNPRQNIRAGCYILGLLSKKYDNVHRVLMSYNMGEKRTRQLWRQGIYSSRYSREVVERLDLLSEEKKIGKS